jgi:enhancer of yellow 2 transcription factor
MPLRPQALTLCAAAYVKERGVDDVKADDMVRAIKPRGRQRVPDHVKAELLAQLRKFIVTGS